MNRDIKARGPLARIGGWAGRCCLAALLAATPAQAVEGMSAEEIAVREKHDQAIAERAACFERHNIDPFESSADVCLAQQAKARQAIDAFNRFMQEKQKDQFTAEFNWRYKTFQDQYRVYPVEELQALQTKHCVTKWGGHDSAECRAIAEQIAMKRWVERQAAEATGRQGRGE